MQVGKGGEVVRCQYLTILSDNSGFWGMGLSNYSEGIVDGRQVAAIIRSME